MNLILLVAIGGAFGSVLRYLLASSLQRATGWEFPIGTVVVNVPDAADELCVSVPLIVTELAPLQV